MYCGNCHEGPFNREVFDVTPSSDAVIQRYYFCGWCRKYYTDDELVASARHKNSPPAFSKKEAQADNEDILL